MLQLQFVGLQKPPVWLVNTKYSIGSSAECDIVFEGTNIAEHHLELVANDQQLQVVPVSQSFPVFVDGQLISSQTELVHGSEIRIGSLFFAIIDVKQERKKVLESGDVSLLKDDQWYLQSTTTALSNKRFTIEHSAVIGRSDECDISLGVSHLSRRHAVLIVTDQGLKVEDLGSSNGTYLNGVRIDTAMLKHGDKLSFDALVFKVINGSEQAKEGEGDKTALRSEVADQIAIMTKMSEQPAKSNPKKPTMTSSVSNSVEAAPSMAEASTAESSDMPFWVGVIAVGLLVAGLVTYLIV